MVSYKMWTGGFWQSIPSLVKDISIFAFPFVQVSLLLQDQQWCVAIPLWKSILLQVVCMKLSYCHLCAWHHLISYRGVESGELCQNLLPSFIVTYQVVRHLPIAGNRALSRVVYFTVMNWLIIIMKEGHCSLLPLRRHLSRGQGNAS